MRAWINIHNRRTTQKSAFAGRNFQNTSAKRHKIQTKKSPFAARTFENQSNSGNLYPKLCAKKGGIDASLHNLNPCLALRHHLFGQLRKLTHEGAGLILPSLDGIAGKLDPIGDGFLELTIVLTQLVMDLRQYFGRALAVTRDSLDLAEPSFGKTTGFTHFREQNFTVRHTSQTFDETELGKCPDRPFGWVPLPWLHAVAVVMLELMVIVVVAFAESQQGHDRAVARGVLGGVWLFADGVTKGVDEERAMLGDHDAGHASNQEATESPLHGIQSHERVIPITQSGRNDQSEHKPDPMGVFVLPHHKLVLAKIGNVIDGRLGIEFEEQPADVRPEKTF